MRCNQRVLDGQWDVEGASRVKGKYRYSGFVDLTETR